MGKYINLYFILFFIAFTYRVQCQITATIKHKNGSQEGEISLSITSGTAPYTINWRKTNDPNFSAATESISGLEPGEYCVIIEDSKCCSAEQCFTVKDECANLIRLLSKQNTSYCAYGCGKPTSGKSDGKASIYIEGDAKDYTIVWKNELGTPLLQCANKTDCEGMDKGITTVEVKNNKTGCIEKLSIELCCCLGKVGVDENGNTIICEDQSDVSGVCQIKDNTPLTVKPKVTPPTNNTNGKIELMVSGGNSSTLAYAWSPNRTDIGSTVADNLAPGKYCYTVSDGCNSIKDCIELYICDSNPMKVTLTAKNLPCTYPGKEKSGILEASVTQGKAPFTYNWAPNPGGQTAAVLNNIGMGQYCVTVTDKGGCKASGCYSLEQHKARYVRQECKDIWYCGETKVSEKDNGKTDWVSHPTDCRYLVRYCKDDPTKIIDIQGPYPTTLDPCNPSCIINEYCPNGKIFRTHIGEPFAGLTEDCVWVEGCYFPTLGKYCIYKAENRRKVAIILVEPTEGFPEGFCSYEIYCNGELISHYTGPYPGSPCERGGVASSLIQQKLDIQIPELTYYDGEPRIVTVEKVSPILINSSIEKIINELKSNENTTNSSDTKIIGIYPNPFFDEFSVEIESPIDQEIETNLFDIYYQKIRTSKYILQKGKNIINTTDLAELKQGVYIYEIIDAKSVKTSKKITK